MTKYVIAALIYISIGFGVAGYESRARQIEADSSMFLVGALFWPMFPAQRIYAKWLE